MVEGISPNSFCTLLSKSGHSVAERECSDFGLLVLKWLLYTTITKSKKNRVLHTDASEYWTF